ncbi:MAG: TIGR03086 family metal-binding protein [Trebonia sp.]
MTEPATGPWVLEQAVTYLLDGVRRVTPDSLDGPTPCARWNLRMLLSHTCESLEALTEAFGCGAVGLRPAPAVAGGAEIASVRARCGRLLAACAVAAGQPVSIAGHDVTGSVVIYAGAVEIAVHGWDVRVATGRPQPVPPVLAEALLRVVPLLVMDGARDGLFGDLVPVPASAPAGDRLVAFLGRRPERG